MTDQKQYPRKANKTERTRIIEVFGEHWLETLEKFLDDIIDLYPYEQWNRDTNDIKYKTVGASKRKDGMFYLIGQDGHLYMKGAFSLFPCEKPELEVIAPGMMRVYDLKQAQAFFYWVNNTEPLKDPIAQAIFSYGKEKACFCVNREKDTDQVAHSYEEAEQFYNQL